MVEEITGLEIFGAINFIKFYVTDVLFPFLIVTNTHENKKYE